MEYTPGDIVLVHGTGFFDKLIQFGQSFRFPTTDSFYNHVAIISAPEGNIIEAIGSGVRETHISKYEKMTYRILDTHANEEDRAEAVRFARSCISEGYGWDIILSTGICLLFGLRFSFGFDGEDICSGLVSRALERTQAIFPRDARHMTPADLAKYYS